MKTIKRLAAVVFGIIAFASAVSAQKKDFVYIESPDGNNNVYVGSTDGLAWYSIRYGNDIVLPAARLGLTTNVADFTNLELVDIRKDIVEGSYTLDRSKTSQVVYGANIGICTFRNNDGQTIEVEFRVSDNDVAFRYLLPREGETGSVRILDEKTEFNFADNVTNTHISTYLTPQSDAMIGWKRTKPSYEEYYAIGKPVTEKSEYGHGFTFPCLFKLGNDGWVLISETGVGSNYCGSRLSDSKHVATDKGAIGTPDDDKLYYSYKIEYPMMEENNGNGTSEPALALPGATPWRTVTLGETLRPIVETTIAWDVVEPQYETEHQYDYGKGTWSWIVWQDGSIRMEDQKKYVDLASALGFKYTLVDNWWDRTIGHEGMPELVEYARTKNVDLFLWYSSSGWWNDIEQSPVNIMCNPILRKKEMRWLRDLGVKGIKVDFFGGDKQETMRLYEAILSDADDYGLMVIFHGCTLPRGWERMYPNYVGSEAVRASENLVFMQSECDQEAVFATLHPFIRNTVGCMEFGGCFLNKRLDRANQRGTIRRTTDAFQLATCVLFQNPIQNFAVTPNNLEDAPEACLDFLREVPTTWDETRLIEGHPGKYVVLARRNGNTWYIAAINATDQPMNYSVWDMVYGLKELVPDTATPLKNSEVLIYSGGNKTTCKKVSVSDIYKEELTIGQNDGVVIVFQAQ